MDSRTPNPILVELLAEVDDFLKAKQMRATAFGFEAVGDYGFVSKLRTLNHNFTIDVIHRAKQFIRANSKETA